MLGSGAGHRVLAARENDSFTGRTDKPTMKYPKTIGALAVLLRQYPAHDGGGRRDGVLGILAKALDARRAGIRRRHELDRRGVRVRVREHVGGSSTSSRRACGPG